MSAMQWKFNSIPNPQIVANLAQDLGVELALAQLLVQRGIDNFDAARTFFRPDLSQLHDPFLMKDMDKAVERIEQAIANEENILVYGDYDVDGTTAVSLLSSYLKTIYQNIATYIPDRYDEGYGVSYQSIDFAEDNDISLIIALDCGIKAIDKVDYARKKNIDFVICDHHRPGPELPEAVAVLDPKREDCAYPYKELCGCGVGFKLIQALAEKIGEGIEQLTTYLDLVAIAIAADIVPITGENRVLAHFGLQVINKQPRTGIYALMSQADKKELTITDVVFILAPRINAAGRIKHGNQAVQLLVEQDFQTALVFAKEIERYNNERKQLDKTITDEALQQIKELNEQQNFSTVVYNENWHKGVIGIVASRLTETYYRPTLVFTKSGDKLAASARSVKGFDVYEALQACSAHLEQFGGHKYAAGLTIKEKNYEPFKQQFEKVVKESLPEALRTPEISIDAEIELSQISPKFFRILKQLAPFGPGNRKPVFMTTGLRDNGFGRRVGADKSHLKLSLLDGANPQTFNAIGFGLGDTYEKVHNGKSFKAVYTIEENEWNGNVSLQLVLKDIKED
jgi:single-stranded-DNA-specific exonuclease